MTVHLGATLRLLRVENGFGLRDLARRLGVSSAYLSRVENGVDPVPTADRLQAIARALDLPPRLLVDAAQRLAPIAKTYLEQEPQAAALVLDFAERKLDASQLAQLRRYVSAHFPKGEAEPRDEVEPLAGRLDAKRVVLQLAGANLRDVLEVAAARFSRSAALPKSAALATQLEQRCRELSPAVGAGVAVPSLAVKGAAVEAALVTLAQPLALDGAKASTFVVLLSPERGRDQLARIAHVARLAARGLDAALAHARNPAAAIERVAALEHVR